SRAAGVLAPRSASSTPQIATGAASSTPITGRTASSAASGLGKDSAAKDPPITVPSVKGRTKKDSLALVRAVKAGMENTDWPVRTPPPLAGSILPAHRIVAFYGNPLSKKMRSEEHTSELQSLAYLVCRLLHEKDK